MIGLPEERAVTVGLFIAHTGATGRCAAKKYGISKSTVHKDVSVRLKQINPELYEQVKQVLAKNRDERHIRGGIATKLKYSKE